LLAAHGGFDFAVLLRKFASFDRRWPELRASIKGKPFLTFAEEQPEVSGSETAANLIVDLNDKRSGLLLERLASLYATGAAYAITNYSLDGALKISFDSLELEELISQSRQQALRTPGASENNGFKRPPSASLHIAALAR
jgi:hypothetical protein